MSTISVSRCKYCPFFYDDATTYCNHPDGGDVEIDDVEEIPEECPLKDEDTVIEYSVP